MTEAIKINKYDYVNACADSAVGKEQTSHIHARSV
jgi:hypothetical protein